jgi:signal transduction histidine kinase
MGSQRIDGGKAGGGGTGASTPSETVRGAAGRGEAGPEVSVVHEFGTGVERMCLPGHGLYNSWMTPSLFEEMKDYVGFDARDASNLRVLGPVVEPHIPRIVDRFYREIQRQPGARQVLSGGPAQQARLRKQLHQWVKTLFCGRYDEGYCERRFRIGHAHVRAGLPQHYMFTAMEVVRQELESAVLGAGLPDPNEKLGSLYKLLSLELAMMLESYRESYSEQVRQIERSAVQERLTQAEHLARIGRLAASLAHEIKNPLAGISGAIQVIRDDLTGDDPRRPILAEILRQINRLDGTVKDLLVYARPQPPRFQRCELGHVVEHVLAVLRREPEAQRVRFELHNDPPVPPLEADENQLEQLLMNLLMNAAHASSDGSAVRLRATVSGDMVRLDVEDSGAGMDAETCRRAFEPFFTTKARGTGLGLSICDRIVRAHGGSISIQSALRRGTTVTVRLPRHRGSGGTES